MAVNETGVAPEAEINAQPTKTFFVEMLTKDIPLEQAILDLVDNSVDGAKALGNGSLQPFEGRSVNIHFSGSEFRIADNCGGFSRQVAREYAFRFGRPSGTPRTRHSIGQFGVGMKRALFKFGDHFVVRSATETDAWAVDVHVPEWEANPDSWTFAWAEFTSSENLSTESPGTEIVVTLLHPEVAAKFGSKVFEQTIVTLIKTKHRQFIAEGLQISVNGVHVDATALTLLFTEDKRFNPGIDSFEFVDSDADKNVKVRIVVGVGPSSPREAGWYVVCNGRVVLNADRRRETGWGMFEEESGRVWLPAFHNQYARFRGIVWFDSNDSSMVPWNTTKTDVHFDSPIWSQTFTRMLEMARPVLSFLNELDRDIDEYTREQSPLYEAVAEAKFVKPENLTGKSAFSAPSRIDARNRKKGPRTVKIQYSRPVDQIDFLMEELDADTAKAVGEKTFDLMYKKAGGK